VSEVDIEESFVLLYLVRHAQSRANADMSCREVDCELTDLGCRQAELVAEALREETFTQVLASPYRRTVATARAIAAACAAPLALLPSGHEHHGIAPAGWIPPTRAELLWRYPDLPLVGDVPETTWHRLPESYEQVAARMQEVLETLHTRYGSADRLLLVSHASPIQQLIGVATGAHTPLEATRLPIGNASLTVLDLSATPARVDALGRSDHLNVAQPVLL
jgi:glucosyl-3-phosphoglycerate phosphatase